MASFWKPGTLLDDGIRDRGGGIRGSIEVTAATFNFSSKSVSAQRQLLPIARHRRQILYAVEKFPIVVIVGETGSGKSTQLAQYLRENGWADGGFNIACTQPRRFAAQTLASRVSRELGTELGREVGYTVRFDNVSSPATDILYVTDGMLLRESTVSDPLLSRYSVVIIDEAHERNLNTDALLGVIRRIRRKRPELRVIVCSATIDAEAFLHFFLPSNNKMNNLNANAGESERARKRRKRWGLVGESYAKLDFSSTNIEEAGTIISIDGRQHPVAIMHSAQPVPDYVRSAVDTALQIHFKGDSVDDGDILCFLPSGDDIERAIILAEDMLPHYHTNGLGAKAETRNMHARPISFLPLYGALPYQTQANVFQPRQTNDRARRVIFSTNIAETSVTIPNITSVIDCGFAKMPHFDSEAGFDRLIVCAISRASARQRAGRAGRTRPGKCYRLYTERDMAKVMESTTQPEVLRTNLTSFILTLKALGAANILSFDLMSIPSVAALSHGLECLYALGAIDDDTNLTNLGDKMVDFPTEPRVSRMLLESLRMGCPNEILSVSASLQVRSLFFPPRTERQLMDYDLAMRMLADGSGDHVTIINLMDLHEKMSLSEADCGEKFVNRSALHRALEVKAQLRTFLRHHGSIRVKKEVLDEERSKAIRKCVTSGFFFNAAKLGNDGQYYTLRGRHMVSISKASVLYRYGESSEYIVFSETCDGSRGGIEVRMCTSVEGKWLREVAPHYWS